MSLQFRAHDTHHFAFQFHNSEKQNLKYLLCEYEPELVINRKENPKLYSMVRSLLEKNLLAVDFILTENSISFHSTIYNYFKTVNESYPDFLNLDEAYSFTIDCGPVYELRIKDIIAIE